MNIGPDELREIGRIGKPHGFKGEIKVIPESQERDRLLKISRVYIGANPGDAQSFTVVSVRPQISKRGLTILLALEQISDNVTVERLRGQRVFAAEADLPALKDGEYYYSDIIGYSVRSDADMSLGVVEDVIERPPQDLLVIRTNQGKRVLVPFVEEFVKRVCIAEEQVIVSLIEGLD